MRISCYRIRRSQLLRSALGLVISCFMGTRQSQAESGWTVTLGAGIQQTFNTQSPVVARPNQLVSAVQADLRRQGYVVQVDGEGTPGAMLLGYPLMLSWRAHGKPVWLGYVYEIQSKGSRWRYISLRQASGQALKGIYVDGTWTRHMFRMGYDLSGTRSRLTVRPELAFGLALRNVEVSLTDYSSWTKTILADESSTGPTGALGLLVAFRFGRTGFQLEPWGRLGVNGFPGSSSTASIPEVESWYPASLTFGVSLLFG